MVCLLMDVGANVLLQLTGHAKAAAKKVGVKNVNVSISHSDDQAVAIAVAQF